MYSVVIPLYNEEANCKALIEELESVMQKLASNWELICINDGSSDATLSILRQLQQTRPFMRILHFARNHGQSNGFAAGFKAARGDFIITMDGDLQNDPKDIPKLIAQMQGADLVVGWRVDRKDCWQKRIISKLSNYVRSRFCKDGIHDTGCSLKIYRTSALAQIKLYKGMHRFLPALFKIEGFAIKEVPVGHRQRSAGVSKYNFFNRSLGPLTDMFVVRWMRKRALKERAYEEL